MQPTNPININPAKKLINPNLTAQQHRANGSTAQACAACKYQRRKCAADCILAPYFPHDRHRQFLNAHRLFGVSNIVKIVRHLHPAAKDHAMRTIIFQSDARAADPVGGCHRIIRDLELQIALAKAELDVVLHHLAICRAAAARRQGNADDAAVDHDHRENEDMMKSLSMDDCNMQMKSILDQLSADDDVEAGCERERYDFHSDGNNILTRDDDARFPYVRDGEHDSPSFFNLTNSDV